MGRDVSVSDRVASWKQLSTLTKVKTEVGERFISSSNIQYLAPNYVFWSSRTDRAAESLDLPNCVRVLIETFLAERS